jgi:hypothetical protein
VFCTHCTTAAEVTAQFVPPVVTVPGVIEAENFAVGGQGIAYYNIYKGEPNTALNNDFRKDAEVTVDVLNELIPESGEYVVGWTEKGKPLLGITLQHEAFVKLIVSLSGLQLSAIAVLKCLRTC